VALNIEAGELLESFIWKKSEEADKAKVQEELADVLAYALLLAEKHRVSFQIVRDIKEKQLILSFIGGGMKDHEYFSRKTILIDSLAKTHEITPDIVLDILKDFE
jgi:dimeric dUTPase (all-alpha-NTP-PPase superfamily)